MPSHMKFKKHTQWSAEDSKREMSRWVSHKPPTDPAVESVQKSLEANMEYFMDNVATFCDKFNNHLTEVLEKNPKAQEALKVPEPETKPTPLLQRRESTVTLDEAKESGAAAGTGGGVSGPAGSSAKSKGPVVVKLPKAKAQGAATTTAEEGKDAAAPTTATTTAEEAKDAATPSAAGAAEGKAVVKSTKILDDGAGGRKVVLKKEKEGDAAQTDAAEEGEDTDSDSDDSSTYDPSPDAPPVEFPDNTELLNQLSIIKREAYELGTTFDGIHDWVALNIPGISVEDNEGVAVMGAVLEQVTSLSGTVREVYGQEASYLGERAEMECSIIKYPDSATLRQQLEVVDADTWDDLDRNWRAMLRSTLILYSTMHKNFQSLKQPKKVRSSYAYAM